MSAETYVTPPGLAGVTSCFASPVCAQAGGTLQFALLRQWVSDTHLSRSLAAVTVQMPARKLVEAWLAYVCT